MPSVRADILLDFVTKFKLTSKVDNNFFEGLATKNMKANRFHEAALIIHKFKFHGKFDCEQIIVKLIDTNRIPIAKQLCEDSHELKLFLIKSLTTNENAKIAASLI